MDEELLQDFLVEAGEILEQLNEQLVELENSPDDKELLNTVFRGFHTIKGGAGFLEIPQMVEICHIAEDVFNLLRNGERHVDAILMDSVLPVLDVLNEQFECLRNGDEPPHAEQTHLDGLKQIVKGEVVAAAPPPPPPVEQAPPVIETSTPVEQPVQAPVQATPEASAKIISDDTIVGGGENISDAEFELLLNVLQNPDAELPAGGASSAGQSSEDITDGEFEQILDNLHGKGKISGQAGQVTSAQTDAAPDSDIITDSEFDQLLDNIHGKGQFNATVSNKDTSTPAVEAASSDEISEGEFDQLLDDIHGKGQFNSAAAKETPPSPPAVAASSDEISEDEFDQMLDNIHGKGQFNPAAAKIDTSVPVPDTVQTADQVPAASAPEVAPPVVVDEATQADKPESPAAKSAAAPKEKSAPQAETTVRVDTKRLDDIMNMVGELVLVRNRIDRLGANLGDEEMIKAVANLDLVTTDLQMSVMKTRMQPIKKVFGRFPRVVRDIARNLKKEIRLEMEGEDTDLDKNLVDALADPLVHLVRNAVDHGIEMPDEREAAGKPREGSVLLKAEQEGDHILLTIKDDGKGMDPVRLREIAVEKGMMDADVAARLSDSDAYSLILAPGFSTKTEISDISGRGVGMDVVKTRINQLNGVVEIDSELGKGSRVSIKLPLTLAIMPTLMVQLEQQLFALPLVSVNEIFHLDLTKTNVVDNQLCVVVRGRTLPLFYLSRWLVKGQANAELPKEGHVVVVHVGNQKVGFVVDALIGQEEVVIKPLGALLHGTEGLSGATITGDGGIAIILDVPGLLSQYAKHAA